MSENAKSINRLFIAPRWHNPGTTAKTCAMCQMTVWLTPVSLTLVDAHPTVRIVCVHCAATLEPPDVIEMSEAQLREIAAALRDVKTAQSQDGDAPI